MGNTRRHFRTHGGHNQSTVSSHYIWNRSTLYIYLFNRLNSKSPFFRGPWKISSIRGQCFSIFVVLSSVTLHRINPQSSSWIQNSEMDSEGKTMALPHTPKKVYSARIGQNPQCKVRAFKEPRLRRGKKSTIQRARHSSLVQGQCRSRLNKQGAVSKSYKFLS